MGEDVHRLKGGTNGATRGLSAAFPDRVLGTPIAENAFVGLAGGIAMDGRYVPVVEFMYPDFMWVAADQVFNQIAKARHMFGGDSEDAAGAADQGAPWAPAMDRSIRWIRRGFSPRGRGLADRRPVDARMIMWG